MRPTVRRCWIVGVLASLLAACDPAPVTGRKASSVPIVQDGGPTPADPDGAVLIVRDAASFESAPPLPEGGAAESGAGSDGGGGTSDASVDLAPPTDAGSLTDAAARADTASPTDATSRAETASSTDAGSASDAASAAEAGGLGDATVPADAGGASDAALARAPRAGELAIVEVLANPSGQDLGREWIELASLASEPLGLSELHVSDGTTDAPVAAGVILPGARIVLGQSSDPAKNGGVTVTAAYGTRLILNNDDEQVSVCVGPCATGLVVDQLGWGTLGTAYDGHAIVVDPVTRSICPATEPFGTAGDFGTPGQPNPTCGATDAGADGEAPRLDAGSG
jgi:hypothetical protein